MQLIVNDGFQNSVPATVTISTQGLSLTPNPLSLTNAPGTLVVILSSPAGPSGQIVNLASLLPNVASVPASVTVSAGALSANITVTPGTTAGSTTILATASGYSNATATVNVSQGPPRHHDRLLADELDDHRSATQNLTLNLSAPAPAGGQTINLSSDHAGDSYSTGNVTFPAGGNQRYCASDGRGARLRNHSR